MTATPFYRQHVLMPLCLMAPLLAMFEYFHWDLDIAQWLYQLENNQWQLRHAWLTDTLIHSGGRNLIIIMALTVIFKLGLTFYHQRQRREWLYLFLSVATSMLLISGLKSVTHMDCPYNLIPFGGSDPYVPLLAVRPEGWAFKGHCFPAGHAGGAYSWVALYYFCLLAGKPRWKWLGLAGAISLGLIFDISQQLRGAHFMSHGLWSLTISWLVASGYYWLFTRGNSCCRPRSH